MKLLIEELQQLWGNILAGEIKSPGSYSLRTMEFLKNISKNEAQLIEKLAQFNISGSIARNEENILNKYGITFNDLLFFQELGVLQGVEAIGMANEYTSTDTNSFQRVLVSNEKALLLTHEDKNKKISLASYAFTSLGKEIISLGSFKANNEYLISVGEKFSTQGYSVKLADWTKLDENQGTLSNMVEINHEKA